jgi:hypothetical protein
MADDELWHVRISADEVKTLTLEQIDDLYRLDVIDADTQLWQDGMDEWLPLRVVAGLDEEEVVNISVPPSMPPKFGNTMSWPPPAVAGTSPANSSWPPPAVARPSPANSSWPPAVSPSAPPSARSVPPIPPSSRPNAAAFASTVPTWPPGAPPSKSQAPSPGLFAPSYAPPASVRPQVVAEPYNYPRPINPMPIVFAAIVGLVITLYRNEVIYAGARTVGQEAAYLKLEQALGGPGFGTPRAVEPMAKAADSLDEIAPLPTPTSTSKSDSSSSSASDSNRSAAAPKATTTATPVTDLKKVSTPAPQPQSAPRPVARPEADTPNPVFKQPKGAKKAKGNEFDPLNPNL